MKKLADKTVPYIIRGMILPMNPTNSPVFLEVDGKLILPLFTTRDKFNEAAKWGGFSFAKANVVLNPQDFHDCVMLFKKKFPFHVAIDPYLTPEGNTRFQMAIYDEEEQGIKDGQEP